MKNWLKILKFTLQQAIKGSKFITSTAIAGIVILVGVAVTNIFLAGAFNKEEQIKALKAVYIVNETDYSIDTDSFVQKHQKDYPNLQFSELNDVDPQKAASDPATYLGDNADYSIVLQVAESEDSCDLTVYIPKTSLINSDESADFIEDFADTIKNAKIKSTGISEEKLNMAISDISFDETKADAVEEEDDYSLLSYLAHMLVMLVLYFLVIFYGQSIGQIVSMEKTSKLNEYLLTLSEPSGIIFGKVTAIFCEAVIQIVTWVICGFAGLLLSNSMIKSLTGEAPKSLISTFMEAMPEGTISDNFGVLLILAIIALLAAFLFYCFVSALFASFAATAEELTQTTGMSVMTMLFGFIAALYVPSYTGSEVATTIIRIIPFTAAFALPGDIASGHIGILEFVLYLAILLVFTVLLALLTGRVYKSRLFKKGTKGMFAEIVAAITGKVTTKAEDEEDKSTTVYDPTSYERYDKAKKTYTIVGFALLAFMLAANVLGGLVGSVIGNMIAAQRHIGLTDMYEDTTFLVINNCIAIYLIAVPISFLVMKLTNDSVVTVKEKMKASMYLRCVFVVFPVAYALNIFSQRLASLMTSGEAENTMINTLIAGDNIPAFIMVSFLAPIFEELVFRKFIIDRTRRYGEFTAIMFSSIAFGLFHCNLYQLFYAFAIGLVLGYVYVKTGNVLLTIIIHLIVNTSSSLAPIIPTAYQYFAYAMLVLGVLSLVYTLIKRDVKLEPERDEVPSKELSAIAYRNSGTVLFAVVCIMIMCYQLFAPMILK
ncbi:MAG: CPBP family intramembrane metalloprotease [Butyrivibrio sp.]|uniref:CPBP family glutamic-type intramembrane protease n=1 Tax=Butyrivibrio sp. TaxID=28121 RepID=UPI0025BB8E29|nr:CPBP family glutamic-type intramembrane protease [Butyrivibrio sp.]MBQ6589678.1 CPBP family intramembrane metalloprotease [Butyrivibrio sp.]